MRNKAECNHNYQMEYINHYLDRIANSDWRSQIQLRNILAKEIFINCLIFYHFDIRTFSSNGGIYL